MKKDILLSTTGVFAVLAMAPAAWAQSAPPAPPASAPIAAPAEGSPDSGGIKDIVVTARKRTESVQDVPAVVTAISAEQVRRADLTSIERIAARTPNFTVGRASNGAGAQLSMRGIGSPSTSIGIEQSVAVVVDGVYYGQGRVINEGFFDLGRIEILKGPQALFFGKNATAGVVSLTSADPTSKKEFRAKVDYDITSQQLLGEFVASGPLTDTLGIRAAFRASKQWGGWYTNIASPTSYNTFDVATGRTNPHAVGVPDKDGPHYRELLGRITLKWEPIDHLTVTGKLSAGENFVDTNVWNYVMVKCQLGHSTLNPAYGCGRDFVTHAQNLPSGILDNVPYAKKNGDLYNTYRSWQGTANINYTTSDINLTSITNYQWNNNHYAGSGDFQNSPTGTFVTENTSFHAFSSEFRALTTFNSPVNLLVGALYQKTRRPFGQWILFGNVEDSTAGPNRYLAIAKDSYTAGETASAFGQVIWKVVPTVEATAGVRYTHETKDSYFNQYYVNAGLQGLFRQGNDASGLGIVNAHQLFTNWSPEATITWKPHRDLLVYGAYKTGYKSGGFSNGGLNSQASANPTGDLAFGPEKAAGFEGGFKSTLFDRQLRFNVTAYSYKYNGLQVDFFNSPIFAFQTLTADARTKGIETELEYAPRAVPGLNLHGAINYNHARYTRFIGPCFSGERPAEGCLLNRDGSLATGAQVPGFQRLDGKKLSMAADWTGAVGVGYDSNIGSDYKIGGSVDVRYSGSYIVASFNNPDSRQPKYAVLDATIRYGRADQRWEVAVIGKNLSNHFYGLSSQDGPSTGSGTGTAAGIHADQFLFGGMPRTVQLEFSVKF